MVTKAAEITRLGEDAQGVDGTNAWNLPQALIVFAFDLSSVLQFSPKVGFENSLIGVPYGSFRRG